MRLWLVINDFLKFDLKQMFNYYDYLEITFSDPPNQLIHLTNKEIDVYGNYFINGQGLSCILMGDNIKLIVTQANYISQTRLKCPLTHLVHENTHVKLHITNDINYFKQVNRTSSGRPFTVRPRLEDTLDLSLLNNQQQLNLAKIQLDM